MHGCSSRGRRSLRPVRGGEGGKCCCAVATHKAHLHANESDCCFRGKKRERERSTHIALRAAKCVRERATEGVNDVQDVRHLKKSMHHLKHRVSLSLSLCFSVAECDAHRQHCCMLERAEGEEKKGGGGGGGRAGREGRRKGRAGQPASSSSIGVFSAFWKFLVEEWKESSWWGNKKRPQRPQNPKRYLLHQRRKNEMRERLRHLVTNTYKKSHINTTLYSN